MLHLHCCARAFSDCSDGRLLFVVVGGLLTAVALLLLSMGSRACGLRWVSARRLSSCGSQTLEDGLSNCGSQA